MSSRIDGLPDLFAYMGEDEFGSGEIGIKQGAVPAGMIPLVTTTEAKIHNDRVIEQLARQAHKFGKTISLVRYTAIEVIEVIKP